MVIAALRRLRHGRLKFLEPVWRILGHVYRAAVKQFGTQGTTVTRIGPYGPFRLNGLFAFSDFEHWGGGHNDAFRACIEACRGKSCVLDVGGHIGLVTLPMATVVAPGGKVFAFEPAEPNRRLLVEHIRLNDIGNVEVVGTLVGERNETSVRFFEMHEPTGMNSVAAPRDSNTYREIARPQVSLDSFCAERGLAPEVVKIDVEGAEIGVLRGAREMLRRHRPRVFLSVHPREIASLGESISNLTALIDDLGYDCFDAQGVPPKQFELREYTLLPRRDKVHKIS